MRSRWFSHSILIFLFLLLVFQIVVFRPEPVDKETEFDAIEGSGDQLIEQRIFGLHSVGAKNESRDWELWADEAVDFKDSDLWSLKKVRATFFAADGGVYNVIGEKGYVNLQTRNLRIQGDVVTESGNGYRLRTKVLDYHAGPRQLRSQGGVELDTVKEISGETTTVRGGELFADLDKSLLSIDKTVIGERTMRGGKRMKIQAKSAEFSNTNRQIKFVGDVVIDYDTMRITGPEAIFDYNEKKKKVTRVLIDGGVRMTDVNRLATAKKLAVDVLTNRFVLTGQPRVVQDNDELFGEEIVLSQGGKNVEVRKVRAKVEKGQFDRTN